MPLYTTAWSDWGRHERGQVRLCTLSPGWCSLQRTLSPAHSFGTLGTPGLFPSAPCCAQHGTPFSLSLSPFLSVSIPLLCAAQETEFRSSTRAVSPGLSNILI